MKIVIIGGYGTIGKKVADHFSRSHEVILAGRNSGDVQVDISKTESIEKMYREVQDIEAVICIAGEAKWAPFSDMDEADYTIGLQSKLMGQVNLVRYGAKYLTEGSSITLTTGILADDPVPMTTSAAMVNGGIHSFVKAVDLEIKKGIRVNAVSSGLVEDAVEKYESYFPGHNPVPMDKVVRAYVRSVEGKGRGEIIRIYE
ncbi:short chain dehydrogenase [Zeaxanthinibacter enoshimensis]|uniref:NAD(P)-dependent dehydrogenase (Short-subunit alcohol dehydrogenase family) n=1 Tax=Zeaxanthinibacter enoshimensis TaxID=392009 RepID=A0A4R6TK15_9FLAO|nr:short chain dehydrogenase [Zeaxanthinibacter enoshimensis]TDQ29122.1 NAD(P)-dependent dehydrogenase (short-subunit alcohol dehydrogenase family) [Zeaxanthinibacter enoshimensis]